MIEEMIMSTISSSASHTFDIASEPNPRSVLRRISTIARTYWSAAVEGLAAARSYQELTRCGATHEQAVEQVFDRHLGAR
jgi:hypothetical protein